MFKERRERLLKTLPEYSITVLYSGKPQHSIGYEIYPFKVDRSFFYFTGIDASNMSLVLFKLPSGSQQILFIEPFDPVMAKWVGAKMLPEEATSISGIKDIRYVDALEDTLSRLISNYGKFSPVTLCGKWNCSRTGLLPTCSIC